MTRRGGWHARQPVPTADRSEDWRHQAACAGTDPQAFYPEKGGNTRPARRICRHCPVRTACRDYALAAPIVDQYGVWGGMSPRERQAVLRRRKEQP